MPQSQLSLSLQKWPQSFQWNLSSPLKQFMRLKSWMLKQLSQPGPTGGGQLAGGSSLSVQANGVEAGEKEKEGKQR